MSATGGDIAYESAGFPGRRGDLVTWLCDALEVVLPPMSTERYSNGQVADTLLAALDVIVTTDEQRKALREFCATRDEPT